MSVDGGGAVELRVAVLGPLYVECDHRPVRLGPKLASLLSVLVMELGHSVPGSRLIDLLWTSAPSDATLRSHISHLRRLLGLGHLASCGDDVLATVRTGAGAGYRLDLAPDRVDARVFERKLSDGRLLLQSGTEAEARRAAGLLREALALWRGPAFVDIADLPLASAEVARLRVLRRSAQHSYGEALFSIGRYTEVVSELTGVVAADPCDEGLRRLLAQALYAEHRVDEAAEVCREGLIQLRQRGLDAPELHELQRSILTRRLSTPVRMTVPRLLPPVPPGCVGRDRELKQARQMLCGSIERPRTLIVTGPAGIGKTSFAIRLSHSVAGHFPDGQLYINLRGFDPSDSAMNVSEAVRILLTSLGMSPRHFPDGLDSQLALYREMLSERRALILLDNARDAEQVRPLLPGSLPCAVVVTSRSQLTSIVSVDCALPLTLDLLTVAEAHQMLRTRLGAGQTAAEPTAMSEIIEHCGRLPLTLAVAAARAATHPHFSLASLATELRDPGNRLDAFVSVEAAVDIRAVFSWSYRTLSDAAARLFRLLALHPGPDITTRVAAGLTDVEQAQVRRDLAELADAHLVTEHMPGRYILHDMVRAYAADLVNQHDERRPARNRMFDYYLRAACAGALLINSYPQDRITVPPATPGVPGEEHGNRDRAIAWFAAERAVLLAVIRLAANTQCEAPLHAWRLIRAMVDFLDRRGYWHDWLDLASTALRLAERLGDTLEEARAHRQLGLALARLTRYEDAERHLWRALELFADQDDRDGRARTHHNLAWLLGVVGRHGEALGQARQALDLFHALDDQAGLGRAFNAIGWCRAKLGDVGQAVDYCRRAVDLLHDCGDSVGEAATWDSLGYAYHNGLSYGQAVTSYRRTVEIYEIVGDRYGEATALERLGDVYRSCGDIQEACGLWERAAAILSVLGHPTINGIHDKIHANRPSQ